MNTARGSTAVFKICLQRVMTSYKSVRTNFCHLLLFDQKEYYITLVVFRPYQILSLQKQDELNNNTSVVAMGAKCEFLNFFVCDQVRSLS